MATHSPLDFMRYRLLTVSLVAVASAQAQSDTGEARKVFERNIASVHRRDRAAYLATYEHSPTLARNGPGGLQLGYADLAAGRDTTWPDTLVARDVRMVPLRPGVVYATYHYRVTQRGVTSEGVAERLFVKTPQGWKIGVTGAFAIPFGSYPQAIAIVGATIVNPGSPPVPDGVVVSGNGRIVCAGSRHSCPPPANAELVDARGSWVIPGLIDAHVHYSQTGWIDGRPDAIDLRTEYPYDSVVAALRVEADRFHRAWLCSGVTSVYDVGGYPWTIAMAQRTNAALDAPRVVAAGPLLTTVDHWLNTPSMRQFVPMASDSAVRRAIRANVAFGAWATKVWYIQVADSLRPAARALLNLAGAESRSAGVPLIVHATQLARAKEALQAGATLLVHSVETDTIDSEFIALARQNNAMVIPTLTVREGYADVLLARSPAQRYPLDCVDRVTRAKLERMLPAEKRGRALAAQPGSLWDRQRGIMEENLRRLKGAGIPIATGTDAGNPGTAHGPSIYREMEAMQNAGMTPAEVLASSTIIAARAARLDKDTGSLDAGKRADLVILDADPLANSANLKRVRMVMRNGSLYGRRELMPK